MTLAIEREKLNNMLERRREHMIRLTRVNGKALYINPQHLIEVGYDEDYAQTLVSTTAEGWYVLESPEDVARKVLEWRLAMERYRASCIASASEPEVDTNLAMRLNEKDLKELAGLEE